jgi:hypothetical protein
MGNKTRIIIVALYSIFVIVSLSGCHDKSTNSRWNTEYITFGNEHYNWWIYYDWWNCLDSTYQNQYSHRLPWDHENNRPLFNDKYYEYIGKYDQFQVGWDDIGTENPPPPLPGGIIVMSPHRSEYLRYYRKAHPW